MSVSLSLVFVPRVSSCRDSARLGRNHPTMLQQRLCRGCWIAPPTRPSSISRNARRTAQQPWLIAKKKKKYRICSFTLLGLVQPITVLDAVNKRACSVDAVKPRDREIKGRQKTRRVHCVNSATTTRCQDGFSCDEWKHTGVAGGSEQAA